MSTTVVERTAETPAAKRPGGWSAGRRILVSCFLIFHVFAIFLPPFTFQTSPVRGLGSPLAEGTMSWLHPYIDAVYLNHGYAFFAPDPGPSHLLVARLEFEDERPAKVLTYPNLQDQWPRLLYHRHFMLSEHLHSAFVPPELPPEMAQDPLQRANWELGRQLYLDRRAAIERYLKKRYGASEVKLIRVEHRLLDPPEAALEKKRIDAPDTFIELSEEAIPEEVLP